MPNAGSEQASKQDTTTFSTKLPSTKQRATVASASPSFRIYYYDGAAGSVPFEWESHPGTPKHTSSDLTPPPPLTPPPSHFSFSANQIRRRSKNKILALIPTKLFWLSSDHSSKVKKVLGSSLSERVLMDENEYDLFKIRTEKNGMRRFSSFDSSADYSLRRSHSTFSCFGIRRCFIC